MSLEPVTASSVGRIRNQAPERVDFSLANDALSQRDAKYRPLLGGIKVESPRRNGTLGICLLSKTGGKRLLTAGHLFDKNDIGAELGQAKFADVVGALMEFAPDFDGVPVDVAMVNVSVDIDVNAVLGSVITYWIDQSLDWTEAGDVVQIEGAASGTQSGKVKYAYTVITGPDGEKDVAAIADYKSDATDSGAPVIFFDKDDKANLVGLHGGKTKIQDQWYSWFVPMGAFSDWAYPE